MPSGVGAAHLRRDDDEGARRKGRAPLILRTEMDREPGTPQQNSTGQASSWTTLPSTTLAIRRAP